ncbi:endoribonuclease L-PSP family protein [Asticcacaulis biprosthecium C19]|uniref:Endoribonuclease L-PSP family protein n=1 Tax=Asticcacaulis biprosthecium C19 TaxID=715226 RepID=F4QQP2_9CAUL|nr:RidA family protein [Asticcacaulis biprosthecium]EGF90529.1 endoribonuclease L-PSP family protein [Asticcacaulis biprosthecium C19]
MPRQLVSSGSPFEGEIGFSRAVRTGNRIEVSGTAPIRDGKTAGIDDLYEQTRTCLDIIVKAVEQAGGKPSDIIRTRIFLTDISRWKEAAKAHGEIFGDIRPASSFIGSSALINSEWLVEIEASAQIED